MLALLTPENLTPSTMATLFSYFLINKQNEHCDHQNRNQQQSYQYQQDAGGVIGSQMSDIVKYSGLFRIRMIWWMCKQENWAEYVK